MKKSFYSIVLLSLMLLFFSAPAFASTTAALSKASLDMSNFTSTFNFMTTGDFAWSGFTSTQTATATANGTTVPAPGTPIGFAQVLAAGLYNATGEAKQIGTSISSTALAGPEAMYLPSAGSSYIISASWTYTAADAEISFSIPYSQSLGLIADPGITSASGYSLVKFDLWNETQLSANGLLSELGPRSYSNGQVFNDSRKLSEAFQNISFYQGDTGTVYFEVTTQAATSAVPVPAALWLLGSGLIGLVGIRRKLK